MADLSNAMWSETDASNNSSPPDGWPAGMTPNNVEPTARAGRGAVKRFWDRINGTVTSTGSAGAYAYATANATYPVAYVHGEIFTFKANFGSQGSDTLNINGLGPRTLYNRIQAGVPFAIGAGDIPSGSMVTVVYDATIPGFQLLAGLSAEQYVSNIVLQASSIPLSNAVISDITSLVVPRGDWNIWGEAWFTGGTAIGTRARVGINTVSVTYTTDPADNTARTSVTTDFTTGVMLPIGPARAVVGVGGQTYYLSASALFSSGTMSVWGKLSGRRG